MELVVGDVAFNCHEGTPSSFLQARPPCPFLPRTCSLLYRLFFFPPSPFSFLSPSSPSLPSRTHPHPGSAAPDPMTGGRPRPLASVRLRLCDNDVARRCQAPRRHCARRCKGVPLLQRSASPAQRRPWAQLLFSLALCPLPSAISHSCCNRRRPHNARTRYHIHL